MNRLLAATLVASIPLAAMAGQPDRTPDPANSPDATSTEQPLTFEQLDANKDGRISMPEASADPKLVESFSTADKNGDGYLDRAEFANAVRTPPHKQ